MANTVTANPDVLNIQTGLTAGNEVIIKVDPRYMHAVDALVTSAGSAQLFCSVDPAYNPVADGFSGMTPDDAGAQATNFNRQVGAPVAWIGLKVTSGTWSLKVHQRKAATFG